MSRPLSFAAIEVSDVEELPSKQRLTTRELHDNELWMNLRGPFTRRVHVASDHEEPYPTAVWGTRKTFTGMEMTPMAFIYTTVGRN